MVLWWLLIYHHVSSFIIIYHHLPSFIMFIIIYPLMLNLGLVYSWLYRIVNTQIAGRWMCVPNDGPIGQG